MNIKNKILIIEDSVGDEIMHVQISEQGSVLNIINGKIMEINNNFIRIQQKNDFFV